MFNILNNHGKSLDIDKVAAQNFSQVNQSINTRKHYYQTDEEFSSIQERITKFSSAVFKTIFICVNNCDWSDLRSQLRESWFNRKEIILQEQTEIEPSKFLEKFTKDSFLSFIQGNQIKEIAVDPVVPLVIYNNEELLISSRHKSFLFEDFASYPNLEKLEIKGLEKPIPKNIGLLTKLKKLSLENMKLKTLPEEIGQLLNLTIMNVSNNQLESLPQNIANCSQLQQLIIEKNCLKIFPKALTTLYFLKILSLSNNQIRIIPSFIGQLVNLRDLILQNNHLDEIPECLYDLNPECRVYLKGNPLCRSSEIRKTLEMKTNEEGYSGPQFIF